MTTKLELVWSGKKEASINPEPRILFENPELSNVSLDPDTSNMLIHGDNLMVLKALERDFAGKVKCIYIDPPYNTGAAFEHYDDNFEHSTWLGLMKPEPVHISNASKITARLIIAMNISSSFSYLERFSQL